MTHITIIKNKFNGFFGHSTIKHDYEVKTINRDRVVLDHTTGLMWHKSGPKGNMRLNDAKKWVQDLNSRGYAGYNDWRFPTVEEAASLLESNKKNGNLHLDSKFDNLQQNIWTGDSNTSGGAWHVNFAKGFVSWITPFNKTYVRPVRSSK